MLALCLKKRLKQLGHVGVANPDAKVLDTNIGYYFEAVLPCRECDNDFGLLFRKFNCVLYDINENLLHPHLVNHNHFGKSLHLVFLLVMFKFSNDFDFHIVRLHF